MSKEYQKLHERLILARRAGDSKGKAELSAQIRNVERESARNGKVLTALASGDTVRVEVQETPTKRSLQEEYIRKFDNQTPVDLGGKEPETLQQFHKRRLLGRR